jgi:hypothetical protein
VVAPLLAVVVAPLLAVVVPPLLAVVAPPPPAWAPPALPPLGCDAGAAWAAGAAFGAGALLFFCPQARLGTVIRLKINNHLAAMVVQGRVNFIVTLL